MRQLVFIIPALAGAVPATAVTSGQQPTAIEQARPINPRAIVADVRRIIAARYVLPEKRPALDAVLAQGLSSGRYLVTDPAVLAERVGGDLARVGQDRHLDFDYDPRGAQRLIAAQAAQSPVQKPTEAETSSLEREVRARNHGITELRVLPGNIRYMVYDQFYWVEGKTTAVLDNAVRFLADADAIIIDLRNNVGGSGDASEYLTNHFLPANKLLYTYYDEGAREPKLIMTTSPPVGRLVGKPLYVLTSGETASAAEAFTGSIAAYRAGEIVGGNTAGAGYENKLIPIDNRFVLSVSVGRILLAPTGRDWERVGIAPTIPAAVPAALDVAQAHALRRIATNAPAEDRAGLMARAEWLEARIKPRSPSLPLSGYVGKFGERTVKMESGKLHYQFGERPRRLLIPLGGNLFAFEDDHAVRIKFAASGNRTTALEVIPVGNPPLGRYERTE